MGGMTAIGCGACSGTGRWPPLPRFGLHVFPIFSPCFCYPHFPCLLAATHPACDPAPAVSSPRRAAQRAGPLATHSRCYRLPASDGAVVAALQQRRRRVFELWLWPGLRAALDDSQWVLEWRKQSKLRAAAAGVPLPRVRVSRYAVPKLLDLHRVRERETTTRAHRLTLAAWQPRQLGGFRSLIIGLMFLIITSAMPDHGRPA